MKAALPGIDVFVPSLDEARHHTGCHEPREISACYRRHGAAGIVGVKCGSQGSVLSPSAGLVIGLLRGMPVAEAGRLGAATAACCVTQAGAARSVQSVP